MTTNHDVTGWTVVIVEDDPDNLGVPKKILTHYGATVHTATDGVEGLKVLASVTPTLILLDLSMPNMDGWAMLKELRANPVIGHTPVIAVTAHAMQGDRERALAAGFDGYITKPYRLTTFMDEVQKYLCEHV
jgi:two-component system cell cycle response regulator DivK